MAKLTADISRIALMPQLEIVSNVGGDQDYAFRKSVCYINVYIMHNGARLQ